MTWRPTASPGALRLRAQLNALVRGFFAERGVLEVETPLLSRAGNTDPNIASFAVAFSGRTDGGPRTRWLRTSAEFPMKRLLADGVGDCYELGRVFRDGEAGGRHNPEFTMLEWYRVGWDHLQLVDEAVALVQLALALVEREASVARIAYRDLYLDMLGIDPMTAPSEALQAAFDGAIDPEGLSRDDWLDLLMTHRIQPRFPPNQLLAVHDYPASQCALARVVQRGDVAVAERFELYLGPLELANGYHELRDAPEQQARFARDLQIRAQRGAALPAMDAALLEAMASGLPGCAGVALGIDRLLMAMLGTGCIEDVLAFAFNRA
jgi:elongation factor P--(R)-beta-lysine ligase